MIEKGKELMQDFIPKEKVEMEDEWIDMLGIKQLSLKGKFAIWKRHVKHNGFKQIVKIFVFQHIFRINSRIPWPVHWTSNVVGAIKYKNGPDLRPNLGLSIGCYIQGGNGIEVGTNVRVGPGVKIIGSNHDVNDYNKHVSAPPIKIGDNVWVGSNSVILPGVEIGNHTVVAAGAVVTKSFKEGNCILGGVPAKIVKKLPDYKGGV